MSNIPSKIHYCWFGKNPLPEIAKKCIKSWEKYCPGFEIIEWNESNFDVKCCKYVSEAYEAKKWAFVSDYARFKILYENGGIYFDTDVELIKPINDLLQNGPYMGLERILTKVEGAGFAVNPGLGLAAYPKLDLLNEMLSSYNNRHFVNEDGSLNYTTIVEYTTEVMRRHGLRDINKQQNIDGVIVYPCDYFAPKNYFTRELLITENTRSIHHYDGTWASRKSIFFKKAKEFMGPNLNKIIYRIMGININEKN